MPSSAGVFGVFGVFGVLGVLGVVGDVELELGVRIILPPLGILIVDLGFLLLLDMVCRGRVRGEDEGDASLTFFI